MNWWQFIPINLARPLGAIFFCAGILILFWDYLTAIPNYFTSETKVAEKKPKKKEEVTLGQVALPLVLSPITGILRIIFGVGILAVGFIFWKATLILALLLFVGCLYFVYWFICIRK